METPNLRLRKISQSDLQDFHEIWSNPLATKWSSCGPKKTLAESQAWLNGILPSTNPSGDNYAVFQKSSNDGRMIGIVGVFSVKPEPEVGYTFHPEFWGKGYGTEALRAFMQVYWVDRPGVQVVVARCDVENRGSRRVLEKAGFVRGEVVEGAPELPGFAGEGKRRLGVWRCFRPGTGVERG